MLAMCTVHIEEFTSSMNVRQTAKQNDVRSLYRENDVRSLYRDLFSFFNQCHPVVLSKMV